MLVILHNMARTRQTRKRSGGAIRRPFKKRRVMKRRRKSNASTYTSRSLNPSNAFKIRARKVPLRRWRNMLWRDSMMSTHYRSILAFTNNLTTPVGIIALNFQVSSAMTDTNASAFWKTVGGAQDPSFGITPDWMNAPGAGVPEPTSIILRGGRIFTNVANPSTTDTLSARIQLMFVKGSLRNTTDTAASNTVADYITALGAGPRPNTWSIQDAPDYHQYFYKPVIDKIVELRPGDDAMVAYKLKVSKIDVQPFLRGGGFFPVWAVYCNQSTDAGANAATLTVSQGHNISFSVMDTNDV